MQHLEELLKSFIPKGALEGLDPESRAGFSDLVISIFAEKQPEHYQHLQKADAVSPSELTVIEWKIREATVLARKRLFERLFQDLQDQQ